MKVVAHRVREGNRVKATRELGQYFPYLLNLNEIMKGKEPDVFYFEFIYSFSCSDTSLWFGLSLVVVREGYCGCSVWASHVMVFPAAGLQVLRASVVAARALSSCGSWTLEHSRGTQAVPVESSQTRDQTHVLCIVRRILSHWNTREVLNLMSWRESAIEWTLIWGAGTPGGAVPLRVQQGHLWECWGEAWNQVPLWRASWGDRAETGPKQKQLSSGLPLSP